MTERLGGRYSSFLVSFSTSVDDSGKNPSFTTTCCPSRLYTNFRNSFTMGSRGLLGALLTYK